MIWTTFDFFRSFFLLIVSTYGSLKIMLQAGTYELVGESRGGVICFSS